ncbi:hypothetical protein GZH82_04315 [Staphylococcus ursi]|uniref:hypothetical protein n=1 Tax=Staphylococcus sp. MI 10-1553 TaxID=1912064 RepID=UPI001396EDD2|nr:hypothetical protein [Staphylococcus sp. MI 10-1553]QHW36640.1 hypothetical protein GZH82_04315 [Staphylococcus sp. MI 10-1553]
MNMSSNKILSSLCYFSVFFAPFIFPIAIWILSSGETSNNAKRALLYHFLPIVFLGLSTIIFGIYNNNNYSDMMFILGIIFVIAAAFYVIKNLYLGIKVLIAEK